MSGLQTAPVVLVRAATAATMLGSKIQQARPGLRTSSLAPSKCLSTRKARLAAPQAIAGFGAEEAVSSIAAVSSLATTIALAVGGLILIQRELQNQVRHAQLLAPKEGVTALQPKSVLPACLHACMFNCLRHRLCF